MAVLSARAANVRLTPERYTEYATCRGLAIGNRIRGKEVGGMILVNRDNPIPPDYRDTIEIINVKVEENFSVPLERETAEKYLELREHLLSIGISVDALSGYRSRRTQERIWNESISAHGEVHTRRYVAMPGYSEHHTGLAIDLTLYDARGNAVEDDDFEAFEQLAPHIHKYGFILRYPAGKEDVTGYSFEPWHIRYVGIEAAREIYESGLTLEEYVSCVCEEFGGQ